MSAASLPSAESRNIRSPLSSALPDWNDGNGAPFQVVGVLVGEGIGAEVVGAADAFNRMTDQLAARESELSQQVTELEKASVGLRRAARSFAVRAADDSSTTCARTTPSTASLPPCATSPRSTTRRSCGRKGWTEWI